MPDIIHHIFSILCTLLCSAVWTWSHNVCNHVCHHNIKKYINLQESIPVGCVPSAAVASGRGGVYRSMHWAGGGVYPSMHWAGCVCVCPSMHWAGGCLLGCLLGGVCPKGCLSKGVSVQRGVCPKGCLPRGCLPGGVCPGIFSQGCLPRGCLPRGFGGYLPSRCLPREVSAQGCLPDTPPWTEWLTDRCKNITLPQLYCGR